MKKTAKKVVKAKAVVSKVKDKAVVSGGKVVKVEDKVNRNIAPEVKEKPKSDWDTISPAERVFRLVKKLWEVVMNDDKLKTLAVEKLIEAKIVAKSALQQTIPGQLEIPIMQRSQPSIEVKYDGKDKLSWTVKTYADSVVDATELALAEARKLLEFEIAG